MNNETLKIIVTLVSTLLPLLGTITTLVIKLSRSEKVKKNAKTLNFWLEEVSKWVKEAEKFLNYSGEEKKNFVENKVMQECLDKKMKYDKDKISEIIEKVVMLSKEVNQREKDKLDTKLD